jgi:hypothetical protein
MSKFDADNIESYSDEELLKHYEDVKQEMEYQDSLSTALKTFLNALYGTTALKSNVFSNGKLTTASITSGGRFANKYVGFQLSKLTDEIIGSTKALDEMVLSRVVQADTDSVTGDSILNINSKEISISDFFEVASGEIEKRGPSNFIKHIKGSEYNTPSINIKSGGLEDKKVNYIMAHKVLKRMFKIKYKNSEVIVTEDHSIIIKRGSKILSVKPNDIKKMDKILFLNGLQAGT